MSAKQPTIAHSITVRAEYPNHVGMLSKITAEIGNLGGDIGAMVIVNSGRDQMLRDITINTRDSVHGNEIVERVKATKGVKAAAKAVKAVNGSTTSLSGQSVAIKSTSSSFILNTYNFIRRGTSALFLFPTQLLIVGF